MIEKVQNQKAWFMVLPVLLLVAFNAVIPLMTVVNYSVQETFGNNIFYSEEGVQRLATTSLQTWSKFLIFVLQTDKDAF